MVLACQSLNEHVYQVGALELVQILQICYGILLHSRESECMEAR